MATPYASVAMFRRDGVSCFLPPRKERPPQLTQARKAACRHWAGKHGDAIMKIVLVREYGGRLEVSERGNGGAKENPWNSYTRDLFAQDTEPHLKACLAELGINAYNSAPGFPDVITLNGIKYRRVD
jgi:hypothetical protein